MASFTIRNLPEETLRALHVRAAKHGRSTEAEVREILASLGFRSIPSIPERGINTSYMDMMISCALLYLTCVIAYFTIR